ncbi:hypothetical protein HHL26_19820 [Sphingobium sp. TB-6]|uniref:hypothetical protein n=1 Tax=Sphingobium sp. TB-6 TaxID=2728850 RepID=UPI00146BE823|nr:hypothetical protein [Sphingobium sp. TB-6]NML91292.1 hypothetical protein [Sphingobium sp. TB-6]
MIFRTLIVLAAFSISPALHAKGPQDPGLLFSALEDDYQWDNKLDHARATLSRAIPLGSSFWTALAILEKAGARCTGDRHEPEIARCLYSASITVHDYYQGHLFWTVEVHLKDRKVGALALDRIVDEN